MSGKSMGRAISVFAGCAVTVALMVAALWAWRFAPELAAQNAERPYLAKLGIRSMALAMASAAQVVLLMMVVSRIYSPRLFDRALTAGFAAIALGGLGAAVTLSLM